jgi:hypothetical protein
MHEIQIEEFWGTDPENLFLCLGVAFKAHKGANIVELAVIANEILGGIGESSTSFTDDDTGEYIFMKRYFSLS